MSSWHKKSVMNFDLHESISSQEQKRVEQAAAEIYSRFLDADEPPVFHRDAHVKFVQKGLLALPSGFIALESSRPWLLFWMLHSLALLKASSPESLTTKSKTLPNCLKVRLKYYKKIERNMLLSLILSTLYLIMSPYLRSPLKNAHTRQVWYYWKQWLNFVILFNGLIDLITAVNGSLLDVLA